MSAFLSLRSLLRGSDAKRAARDEADALAAEAALAGELPERQRAAYEAKGRGEVLLGEAVEGGWPVGLPAERLRGHAAIFGPSGAGKSYLLALVVRGLLRAGVRSLVILDPKSETVDLVKRVVADHARSLSPAAREKLLGRLLCLDLFSPKVLPRLQVLALPPEGDPELHAFEIANLITAELDQGVGIRQEPILHRAIECLVRAGLPLTSLPEALTRPEILDALAERSAPPDLFRATAARLRKEPRERILGLLARVERLLRLRATRLALGGSATCVDFGSMLGDRIALVNLAPPMGSADIGRFLSGLFWIAVSHAIRRRANGAEPCFVMVDEWPTFLAGGGSRLADSFEDLLRLARSKGVFLTVLAQDMASVSKVSRSLPEVLRANMHLLAVFRAADPAAWDLVLPVTGRRRRPPAAPWEEPRPGFVERGAELSLLREELARLPDRECFFADRRTDLPGVRMRTADLGARASAAEIAAIEARAAGQPEVASVAELEAGLAAAARRIDSLARPGPAPDVRPSPSRGAVDKGAEAAPLRRRGKGAGIG